MTRSRRHAQHQDARRRPTRVPPAAPPPTGLPATAPPAAPQATAPPAAPQATAPPAAPQAAAPPAIRRPRAFLVVALTVAAVLVAWPSCRSRPVGSEQDAAAPDAAVDAALPCGPATCPGCCTADGECAAGDSARGCGTGGQECADCAALGGTCTSGVCQGAAACNSGNCPGCCDAQGRCLAGQSASACGTGGAACSACAGGAACVDAVCCLDQDGDGYGDGCVLGADCDDHAPGVRGPCQDNGCPQGWAFVPEGTFTAGCPESGFPYGFGPEVGCGPSGIPEHERYEDAFCMQLTEVSVGAFRECQDWPVCGPPDNEWETNPNLQSLGAFDDCNWSSDGTADRPEHPMNCVKLLDTLPFCRAWMGGDLPTEWQWEKAARGTDGRWYPWGNEAPAFDSYCTECNLAYCLDPEGRSVLTWPVGYLEGTAGDSPYGLKDMCGNVLEFTRSCYDPEDGDRCAEEFYVIDAIARGGPDITVTFDDWDPSVPIGTDTDTRVFYTTFLRDSAPSYNSVTGFRCVRAPVPQP